MKAYAQRNLMRQTLDIMLSTGGDSYIMYGEPKIFTRQPGALVDKPTLELPFDAGQPLFDALWEAGFRPSKLQDADQAIDALQNHIKFAESVATKVLGAKFNPTVVLHRDEQAILQ